MEENLIREQIMEDMVDFLKRQTIQLSNESKDGRVNSFSDEKVIINFLLKYAKESLFLKNTGLKIKIPQERNWYDFAFLKSDNSLFIPIDIKVSKLKNADNTNSKLSIFYVISGVDPDEITDISKWDIFFKSLTNYRGTNKNKDFYFLVVNKNNPKDIFFTSLKTIKELTPNANNLPFQCKWNKNRERILRTHEEAEGFILTALYKSIKMDQKREYADMYLPKILNK